LVDPAGHTVDRPISRAETTSIARAVGRRVGWAVCIDHIWLRRRLPIYGDLFEAARDEMWCPSQCWVLSHALSILQVDAQAVVRASFNLLLGRAPSGSHKYVEKKLEQRLGAPWELNEAMATRLFSFTQPFELRPTVAGKQSTTPPHLLLCDTVSIEYPLRERCWLAIVCAAHADLIWPDGGPAAFAPE